MRASPGCDTADVMSMVGNFLLVSDREILDLLEAPETVHAFLASRVYEVASAPDHVDVDKAWHALHFFLTGTAWEGALPLGFIAIAGQEIGDEDVGYGPARALDSEAVVALSHALTQLTPEALVDRYDGAKMEELEIYPGGWKDYHPKDGDEFGYYSGADDELRALVRRGAASGRGLLIWLS